MPRETCANRLLPWLRGEAEGSKFSGGFQSLSSCGLLPWSWGIPPARGPGLPCSRVSGCFPGHSQAVCAAAVPAPLGLSLPLQAGPSPGACGTPLGTGNKPLGLVEPTRLPQPLLAPWPGPPPTFSGLLPVWRCPSSPWEPRSGFCMETQPAQCQAQGIIRCQGLHVQHISSAWRGAGRPGMESSFPKVAKPGQEDSLRRWGRGWRNSGERPRESCGLAACPERHRGEREFQERKDL